MCVYGCVMTPLACCLTWANLSTSLYEAAGISERDVSVLQLSQNWDQEVSLFFCWYFSLSQPCFIESEVSDSTYIHTQVQLCSDA